MKQFLVSFVTLCDGECGQIAVRCSLIRLVKQLMPSFQYCMTSRPQGK